MGAGDPGARSALKSKTEYELAKIRHALAEEMLREKFIKSPLNGIVVHHPRFLTIPRAGMAAASAC